MRKWNTKKTVPLHVVPERRTERFPPRFRPVGRFCELRFRYLSPPTDREREISRPLDHMRQIPFIHSARLIDSTNFYIYRTVFYLFLLCGTSKCVLIRCIWQLHMRPWGQQTLSLFEFHTVYAGAYGIKFMEFAHARLLSKWNRQYFPAVLFDFCGKNVLSLSVLPVWSKAKI